MYSILSKRSKKPKSLPHVGCGFLQVKSLLILIAFFTIQAVKAQKLGHEDRSKIDIVHASLVTYHIDGKTLNSKIPDRIFPLFCEKIDENYQFLIASEAADLAKEKDQLLSSFTSTSSRAIEHASNLLEERFVFIANHLHTMGDLDFFTKDSLIIMPVSIDPTFSENLDELLLTWKRNIKYQAMLLYQADASGKAASDKVIINARLNKLALHVVEIELCKLSMIKNSKEGILGFVLTAYLDALANSFDPHTEYFSTESKESFYTSLSSKVFSTGLILEEKRPGEVIISYIVPESSAWEQKAIQEGDEVVNVRYKNLNAHPACIKWDDLDEAFHSTDTDTIRVLVKSHLSGQMTSYLLKKRFIENIANEVSHFLLKDGHQEFGYIHFPSFYSEHSQEGSQSSEDLAKILISMKQRKVPGIILDLRGNGGGSIEEAINLAGFFIDKGPLFWTETSFDPKPTLNKDLNTGKLYDGKLIILTNPGTASASEMLIVALKNYQNTITVGSKTYGKATGQEVVPLSQFEGAPPFGYLKVTILKVFGIDGESHQGKGITPSIEIPDKIPREVFSEEKSKYCLEFASIPQRASVPGNLPNLPLESLLTNYQGRLTNDKALHEITNYRDSIESLFTQPLKMALDYPSFKDFSGFNQRPIKVKKSVFHIEDLTTTEKQTKVYSHVKDIIHTDPTVNEAFLILKDWHNETDR